MRGIPWTVVVSVALLSPAAWGAKDPDRNDQRVDRNDQRLDRQDRRQNRAERRERLEKEMHLRRTLRIADEVGLNESQSLAVSQILKAADERRRKNTEDLQAAFRELGATGKGSPTMQDVDARLKTISVLRAQMVKIDDETLEAASKGLTPSQKASLALVLAVHEREMRKMMIRKVQERRGGDDRSRDDDGF